MLSVWMCVCPDVYRDVNQGGTNGNSCCTQRLVILHHRPTNEPWSHAKNQLSLIYLKLPAEEWAWIGIFQRAKPRSPWDACCAVYWWNKVGNNDRKRLERYGTKVEVELTSEFWHQINSPMWGIELVDISRRFGQHGALHKTTSWMSFGPRGQHDTGRSWAPLYTRSCQLGLPAFWSLIQIFDVHYSCTHSSRYYKVAIANTQVP